MKATGSFKESGKQITNQCGIIPGNYNVRMQQYSIRAWNFV